MVALNAKLNNGSECQKKDVALNVKLRTNDGSEHQTKDAALNAKMKT